MQKLLLRLALILAILGNLLLIQESSAAQLTKCGQYDTINVTPTSNVYTVHNNVWNGSSTSQCISVNDANGDFNISYSVDNSPIYSSPVSYSFINKGCHWGSCTDLKSSGMPKQVSNILNAISSWSTVQPKLGVYDVSYDVWFNKTPTTNGQPDGAELMIWLAYQGNIQPLGKIIATKVSVAGSLWNIWLGWNGSTNVVTYESINRKSTVTGLDIKAFVKDATLRSYIDPNWYLISVEGGFEIWQQGLGLMSKSFSVLVD